MQVIIWSVKISVRVCQMYRHVKFYIRGFKNIYIFNNLNSSKKKVVVEVRDVITHLVPFINTPLNTITKNGECPWCIIYILWCDICLNFFCLKYYLGCRRNYLRD